MMKKLLLGMLVFATISMFTISCEKEVAGEEQISENVIEQLRNMGFNPDGIERVDEGYRIERDIIITEEFLHNHGDENRVPGIEQYSTNNLVSTGGSRVITVYAPTGRKGYSAGMIAGIDLAISRYNAENLKISFQRVSSSSSADIVFTRLRKGDERRGILGSAGFPTANGDPYGEIKMSGILESSYGLSTGGIATIIAHEMGHCVGFRHTDYFDRSISCGGAPSDEGDAGIGANHIPGTPTGATLNAQSYMLSCTDGSDRPFNGDDLTALNYLY
jgi:hypothetical protein